MPTKQELLDIAKQAIEEGDEATANAAMDAIEKLPASNVNPQAVGRALSGHPIEEPKSFRDAAGGAVRSAFPLAGMVYDASKNVDKDYLKRVAGNIGNEVAGLTRGAAGIGSTLLWPIDAATDAIKGDREKGLSNLVTGQEPISRHQQRVNDINEAMTVVGANPDSGFYKGGKIASELAGTAGAGGLMAKGVLTAAPRATAIADALATGGIRAGNTTGAVNLGTRVAGGGATGAAQVGLTSPDDAGMGAAIGGGLPIAGKAIVGAKDLAGGTLSQILGSTTGVGGDAIKTAYQSGKGGVKSFLDNLRAKVDPSDVVDEAKAGLNKIREQRQAQYRSGMEDISRDNSILSMAPIHQELDKIVNIGKFKGVDIRRNATGVVDDIKKTIDEWSALPPDQYHTPEGFDALKQSIGDIRDATQMGTPSRKAADQAYNAVKTQIVKQAPKYAEVMGDYAGASKSIDDIQKTLSLGEKASTDTSLRKLQSLMRNNAQSNYGNRASLADQLAQQGGTDIMPALAGQAMNSWMPRGMVGAIEKAGMAGGAIINPSVLAAAPVMSPRIVGEGAYLAGKGANAISDIVSPVANAVGGKAVKSAPIVYNNLVETEQERKRREMADKVARALEERDRRK